MIKFAERLKQLRTESKLSQAQLAKQLSVDQRTISNWEKAIREPDFEMLATIAIFFEVSTNFLLGLED